MYKDNHFLVCTRCFTYNHAAYIKETLDGFTIQKTSFPFVCIIVDDHSTDGEPGVIQKYLTDHFDLKDKDVSRTKETSDYYSTFARHLTNRNCFFAVYLLKYNHYSIKKDKFPYFIDYIHNAKYTSLCEGDDYWIDSNKLQSQADYLERHPDTVLCHTSIKYYYEDVNRFIKSKDAVINKNFGEVTPTDVFKGYRIRFCTVMHRNDVWETIKNDDKSSQIRFLDGRLYYEMVRKGKVYFIPQVMVVYRVHYGSESRQSFKSQLKFNLVCAEMQLRLVQRDNCEASIIEDFKTKYDVTLRNYLLWDSDCQTLLPSTVPAELESMSVAKRLYKKWQIFFINKLSRLLGRWRRMVINEI